MPIHYEPGDDHVLRITIDRPEARNALDMEHFRDLRVAWERFAAADDQWVAIVTGVEKAFCVGADLKTYIPELTRLQTALRESGEPSAQGFSPDDGVRAVLHGVELYKPVIAAVNGTCVGGGMVLLSSCDLRVAADTATFGVTEAKRGLFAGGGMTVRLGRQVPFPAAMELLLCADFVSARRVYDMGLINEVCPPADLLARAYDYAHRITANGPFAVRKTKEAVLRGLAADMEAAYAIESSISNQVFSSEDAVEGPKAFAEKRAPVWKNG
jgi:enoyl-CoA hydratase